MDRMNPYKSPQFASDTPRTKKPVPAPLTFVAKVRRVLFVIVLGIAWLVALNLVGYAVCLWVINREFNRVTMPTK